MPFARTFRTLVLFLLLGAGPVFADPAPPRLVRVHLSDRLTARELVRSGLDVIEVRGTQAKVLEWPGDAARLARLGVVPELIDENPGRTAARRAEEELRARPTRSSTVRSAIRPDGVFRSELLPPPGGGSMGGYWTLAEIKTKLDSLVANDPYDVVADKIDTVGYSRRWPIWGLRLGKTVMAPDTRPVAFFNALTHAREPEGMQGLMYFVEHLLSNYGVDPFATYLLQSRRIYIVPVVNPDGYEVNQNTYFGSGTFGLWRKNIRDNDGNFMFDPGVDGVDINRNFSFRWGKDDIGSSPSISDQTYRGPSAASEPETRVQRDLVISLAPKTGLSFHTYGDLMLHSWGHTDSLTGHVQEFREWSDELTRDNAYQSGPSPHVLYSVNGEFNDWCYGDTLAKPRAFSWTPEVGSDADGFWPAPSRILPLAEECLRPCYVIAAIAGPFVQVEDFTVLEGALNASYGARISVRARNLGRTTAGPGLVGTLAALDPGVRVLVGSVSYPDIPSRTNADPAGGQVFHLAVDDTVTPGRVMRFKVAFTGPDGYFSSDTLSLPLGTPTLRFQDFASGGTGFWTPGSWGIVLNDPAHTSRYFADSPPGNYAPNLDNIMRLNSALNLSAGVHAYAFFESRWEIETNYDAAVLEASLNGTTWTRLRSSGTTAGSGLSVGQPVGAPVFTGARWLWKPERADLSAFTGPAGTAVRIRYRLSSDGFTEYDGFAFDSLRIMIYDPAAQPAPVAVGDADPSAALELAAPWPNPVRGEARFGFTLPSATELRLDVHDVQGRWIRTIADGRVNAGRYLRAWDLRDQGGRRAPPGVYLARLRAGNATVTRRFVVVD